MVWDDKKGDNSGEKKSPMTEDIRETRSRDNRSREKRESSLMARAIQGEKLSKEERKELKKEFKALNREADLELKHIVPVVSKHPRLLAMLNFLGFLIGSFVFLAAGIVVSIYNPFFF